jgi:transposase
MLESIRDPFNKKSDTPMLRLEFSEADRQALNYERYHHPHPRVQQRMEALWLKSQGVPHHQIARLCDSSGNTVRAYLNLYQAGGVEALKHLQFHRPQSALNAHRETIEAQLREQPPQTINEAVAVLETLTGIRRSPTQVRLFLKQLGLKRLKVGLLPAKGNPEEQEEYQKKKLEPRLAEAQAGARAVFFVDAAHFVFGAFLGYLWCFARCWIKAPSGRQRFNVLGALNAVTHEVITVTNLTYINSESVCHLLCKLVELGLQVPITLVLDNARYQRCALVQSVADTLGIELLYLPAYSPNLNLIERLWKFVKKQCLYSKYYADFTAFTQAIEACLATTQTTHKQALSSLLTFNFQSFKKVQALTV